VLWLSGILLGKAPQFPNCSALHCSRKLLSSVGISWPAASLWMPRQLPDVKDSCGCEKADADIWHGGRPAWRWGMVLQPSGMLRNTTYGLRLLLTRQWAFGFHEFRKAVDSERLSAFQWHVLGVSSTKSLMAVHSGRSCDLLECFLSEVTNVLLGMWLGTMGIYTKGEQEFYLHDI
jgi:hypothetical protein